MFWLRYDVFISYSHKDATRTDALVVALRERGYRVFYDKESLVAGDRWKERLSQAIGASRVCLLCWSNSARQSEIVTYEYSRAEALRKPVLPWLLDATPLPQMIEIQGVTAIEPQEVVGCLLPRLGRTLTHRRLVQSALLIVVLAIVGLGIARRFQPPPPWEFSGRVVDRDTRLPLAGVEVDAEEYRFVTHTDRDGRFVLHMPQPKPKYLHLVLAKEGYLGFDSLTVLPDHIYNLDMTRLPHTEP
jgi:hypothetical protein